MSALRDHLVGRVASGRKLLVPYMVGGLPDRDSFPEALTAVAEHADAVEVGLPYSDPLMDGPVIAAAQQRAIDEGVGPLDALDLASTSVGVPRVAMTYYNPIHRVGEEQFCKRAVAAGISGVIVPDLPVEESVSLREQVAAADLAWIPLVAPTSPPERVAAICATTTGFVYAVSTLGVTGTRDQLSERAERVVAACRAETDLPILVGIGVSNAEQARITANHADGVVIGSAVVRALLEEGISAAQSFLKGIREALDAL